MRTVRVTFVKDVPAVLVEERDGRLRIFGDRVMTSYPLDEVVSWKWVRRVRLTFRDGRTELFPAEEVTEAFGWLTLFHRYKTEFPLSEVSSWEWVEE